MATTAELERTIEDLAIERVLEYLYMTKKNGRLVYPLVEIARETALDPATAESVMALLEETGPYTVSRQGGHSGETRWLVRGSVYDVDEWDSEAWNL